LTKWNLIGDFLREHKLRGSVAIAASVLSGFLAVAIPVSIGLYYDLVFNFSTHRSQALSFLPDAWTATTPAFLVFLLVLVLLRLCLMFIEHYNSSVIGEYFSQSLREKMYLHQMKAHMSYYDQSGTGKYLLRYSGDLRSIQNFLTLGLFQFVSDVSLLALAFAAMLMMNVPIAFITFLGIGSTVAILYVFNRHLYRVSEKRRDSHSGLVSFVSRGLRGMLSIKMLNREAVEMRRFAKRSHKLLRLGKTFRLVQSAITSLIPAMSYLVLIGILWYVFNLSTNVGEGTPRDGLVGFVLLFITILPIVRRTLHVESTWEMGSISFRKLIAIFEQDTEAPRGDPIAITGDIAFESIAFSYGDKVIFRDLSFRIPWKQTTLLQIQPGMGRSTILKILTKVYKQNSGVIRYGELDLKEIDPWNIRKAVAIVSESLPLLGRTVFEAISYGGQSDRKKDAAHVLQRIQAGNKHKLGRMEIDSAIGEAGEALSSAQRMQLIYARAFLGNKPYLLIEDDLLWASSRVKENVAEILNEMRSKKTILWIASNPRLIPVEFDGKIRVKSRPTRRHFTLP